jgi:hypothetical protein
MTHFDRLLGKLEGVTGQGAKRRARCPAHEDSTASLEASLEPNGRVSLRCFAGCKLFTILSTLGVDPNELEPDPDEEVIPVLDENQEASSQTSTILTSETTCSIDLRDSVYKSLLELLPLSEEHRNNLIARGLSQETIDVGGYRSISFFARSRAVKRLLELFSREQLLSVPGFVIKDNTITITGPHEGLVVPVRQQGRIVALKVRRDYETDGQKYVYLSGDGGSSCGAPVHVPLGITGPVDTARVTEGELKSDVAYARTGLPTISIAGVSNWRSCLPVLQELRAKHIRLAMDMDLLSKSQVARCLADCAAALRDKGFDVAIERWDPEAGKGIDDLLAGGHSPELLEGAAAVDFVAGLNTIAASTNSIESAGDNTDDKDQEEDEHGPPDLTDRVLPFPVDVFPTNLQAFVTTVSLSLTCPPDLVAVPMLGVAGVAIGASRAVEVKPGWYESPRLYLGVVAPPGSAKTPAASHVCRPLFANQNKLKVEFDIAMTEYTEKEAEWEAARRVRTHSQKKDLPATKVALPPRPVKPVLKRIVVVDATTEALAPILARNERGLIMVMDELTGWVDRMNAYRGGKGADRQFFLSCWSGEPAIVDRKSQSEPTIVNHPFLNVIGGIQTDLLPVLADARRRADGFMDRILLSFPDVKEPGEWTDAGVDPAAREAWQHALDQLFQLKQQVNENEGKHLPRVVQMTPEARALWVRWFNEHAVEMDAESLPRALRGPWAKLKAYAARLALVVHLLRLACSEVSQEDVDEESLHRAIRLINYFKSHARKVYRQLELTPEDSESQRAIDWIRSHGGECTARQLMRANVAGVRKQSEAVKLLRDLVDRGMGTIINQRAANGKEVSVFVVKTQRRAASG